MSEKLEKVLRGEAKGRVFPFFWQHGEDEATLREYVRAIDECGLSAFCVESRPHPDFCGPGWWRDMDVILDEARARGMQVWILDDSHFPTGYANGALEGEPDELRRQSICCTTFGAVAGEELHLSGGQLAHPAPFVKNRVEQFVVPGELQTFDDDRLLSLRAFREGVDAYEEPVDLMPLVCGDGLSWTPEPGTGTWTVRAVHASRNFGPHRSYINMMDDRSCRVLIDAVYEPHYEHYAADFGTTIAGFFSDEPEIGNGHLYEYGDKLGTDTDLPWSAEVEAELRERLGGRFEELLPLLWTEAGDSALAAKVRWQFMDVVTCCVQRDFSEQLGGWCREHGVRYIGHMIEDNNHHSRCGSSLGHYFRGLAGQDMAGIDDIGGQVFPQGEDVSYDMPFNARNGEFYHYTMGALASSAAAISPLKRGDSMCEVFGNYGWKEGVHLEKYLVDHFTVRGVNHFVPHAFSPAPYPDPDCPPHFYAHGHNPQYRHFGALMGYTERVCELLSDGRRVAPAAIIYTGEGDWTGEFMACDPVAHRLFDAQVPYDIVPQDAFAESERFGTEVGGGVLAVGPQTYRLVLVPYMQYITEGLARALLEMTDRGTPVHFVGAAPEGLCDTAPGADDAALVAELVEKVPVLPLENVAALARGLRLAAVELSPASDRVRCLEYVERDGTVLLYLVNEGTEPYEGELALDGACAGLADGGLARSRLCAGAAARGYDAWSNAVYDAGFTDGRMPLYLEPLKSTFVVIEPDGATGLDGLPAADAGVTWRPGKGELAQEVPFSGTWLRSLCAAIDYPAFGEAAEVALPDHLEEEQPLFSGLVRYTNGFEARAGDSLLLEVGDASEGVEVFINGESLGIQISSTYRYDLTGHLVDGVNELAIEVATTLERERSQDKDRYGRPREPVSSRSGITGGVRLLRL